MQALIVHDDPAETGRLRAALTRRGFLVLSLADQDDAMRQVRRTPVDLLILKQVIGGRHTTSVALAGEYSQPGLATILLSERSRAETLELFELIPSLYAVLGPRPEAQLVSTLAVDAVVAATPPVLVLAPQARVTDGALRTSGAALAPDRSDAA